MKKPNSHFEKVKYEDRIRSLERELKSANAALVTVDRAKHYFLGVSKSSIKEPNWLSRWPAKAGSKKTYEVPVANWSDWHHAEVVRKEEVEGANEFNLAVFDDRLVKLVTRTIDICKHHRTDPSYPGIVVNLGGDMVSGNIHEELKHTNELENIPNVLQLAGKLAWALRQMADAFGHVFVPCVVGNHGRNTVKPQMKLACHTSFDWMLYNVVKVHLANDDRFSFSIPEGFDTYYKVFDHKILLTHGDRLGVKGGDGFIGPIGPIIRGASRLRLSYSARGREIDTILMGHWHHEIPLPGLRVNNSLKGHDEFAMSLRFKPTAPSQDLFFVHPVRGITSYWPVQLEAPLSLVENPNWVSWR